MNHTRNTAPLLILLTCLLAASNPATAPGRDAAYEYYAIGNPDDVNVPTRGLIVMQGGGDDVDENYIRMGELGGGGDFVVLRASGDDDYNQYILELCACDSVETLVFRDRAAAFDPFVIRTIRNAEALFIAGGDQSRYVRFWKDTPVQEAIDFVASKPAPVGGTSAGMAVMGKFVYSAMSESLTTESGLGDPYNADLTLARGFLTLPRMGNIITDQHVRERHRIGRTIAFMSRLIEDGWTAQARAIAADRETAVHIDPASGRATIHATSGHETPFVYFMRSSERPEHCVPGRPLTFRGIEVYRVGPGGAFDLDAWRGEGGIAYTLDAEDGVLVSSRDSAY